MINAEYRRILFNDLFSPIMDLTEKKAHDYASEWDTLKNFKVQAAIQSKLHGRVVLASETAMNFIIVKLCRLANLKGKHPQNESVKDTIMDAINYLGLYYACLIDEEAEATKSEEDVIRAEDLPF